MLDGGLAFDVAREPGLFVFGIGDDIGGAYETIGGVVVSGLIHVAIARNQMVDVGSGRARDGIAFKAAGLAPHMLAVGARCGVRAPFTDASLL